MFSVGADSCPKVSDSCSCAVDGVIYAIADSFESSMYDFGIGRELCCVVHKMLESVFHFRYAINIAAYHSYAGFISGEMVVEKGRCVKCEWDP